MSSLYVLGVSLHGGLLDQNLYPRVGILAPEQTVSGFEDFVKLALVGEQQLLSGFREA